VHIPEGHTTRRRDRDGVPVAVFEGVRADGRVDADHDGSDIRIPALLIPQRIGKREVLGIVSGTQHRGSVKNHDGRMLTRVGGRHEELRTAHDRSVHVFVI
jgi:hypothetical protein